VRNVKLRCLITLKIQALSVKRWALGLKLFFRNQESVDNIDPSKQSMNDGPQNGLISAPGNNHSNDGTKSNAGTYINRNSITTISLSVITGSQ
jgi:hypothetical protein